MFFETGKIPPELRYDPFKAIVAPRPIGWISTLSATGVANLAPYSFFNAVGDDPPYLMFSSEGRKDSLVNIEATGEFVFQLVTEALWPAMNATAAAVPSEVDEFTLAGLVAAPCRLVRPPRVEASPAAFECRLWRTLVLPEGSASGAVYTIVIGKVLATHIDDAFVVDGRLDTAAMRPMARLGGSEYAVVERALKLVRPK